jgi:hypothetical protein
MRKDKKEEMDREESSLQLTRIYRDRHGFNIIKTKRFRIFIIRQEDRDM